MINGINHITLSVTDIGETFRFYVEALGFKPVMQSSRSAYFLAGKTWIAAVKGERRTDERYDHVAFDVREAEYPTLVARLEAFGVERWKENETEGASFYFLDPSGNKLELHASNLDARVKDGKANWGEGVTWYV